MLATLNDRLTVPKRNTQGKLRRLQKAPNETLVGVQQPSLRKPQTGEAQSFLKACSNMKSHRLNRNWPDLAFC